MFPKKTLLYLFLSQLLFAPLCFSASVPKLINYQGSLYDSQGQPLETGDYTLEFSIYDSPTSTNRIWGPQIFDGSTEPGHGDTVPVVKGYFNVILGPIDSDLAQRSLANAFVDAERYLEIRVNGGDPILPRQRILSAPYALKSAGGVPVGGIVPYVGANTDIPTNWILCDGSFVSDSESPLNGTFVPDLRGKFLRGLSGYSLFPFSGGSDSHSHSFSASTSFVSFPRASGSGFANGYSPATTAGAFDQSLVNLTAPEGGGSAYDTHGHVGGSAFLSDTTFSASNLPRYHAVKFIVRIK